MIKDAIVTYTCLYIKHIRTHGYNKSLYSFVHQSESNDQLLNYARLMQNELVHKRVISRISRQKYNWNTEGRILLLNDIKTIVAGL